ncbi:HAD family hydrolase [Chryseolinea sp. H1M3-3]|uniref:HAD family hydrolase n=1 Tax=Chryseolinea sp. H1M3-3 TaxID=3034144 RepID=UPI0023EAF520|nr:HAD family hydrolase [Chryseolinea sp. H1M3-3]
MNNKLNGLTIRALCTDIDGTLLDSRRELSNQTIETIALIKESIPIILASSRMPAAMRHLQQQLDILQHPLICYNGGYVIRYDEKGRATVIYSAMIPIDVTANILNLASQTSVHVSLYHEDRWYAPRVDEWTNREATITKVSPVLKDGRDVLKLWDANGNGAHKIMIMGDAAEVKTLEKALRSAYKEDVHVYHSKSTYLEIAPKVISKASALRLLLDDLYRIDLSEVIAFGDNYNDIEMLEAVGWGVAVENARDEVKAVASAITLDSKLDGVAVAIQRYLL